MDEINVSQTSSPDSLQEGFSTAVFPVGGSLCYENAAGLVDSVCGSVGDEPRDVRLDLGSVQMIDSSGLRALLQIRRFCEEHGSRLSLGSVSDCVARIFSLSHLSGTFGVAETAFDATPPQVMSREDMGSVHWKIHEYRAASEPSMISVLRQRVVEAALEAGASGEDLCDIQIAAGEALTNAYKHGSPDKGVNTIQLRCMSCPGAIVVEVQDEGSSFDPDCNGEPDPSRMRDHGMGIYLMREAMSIVEFQCDCPGNRVRMVKWLSRY